MLITLFLFTAASHSAPLVNLPASSFIDPGTVPPSSPTLLSRELPDCLKQGSYRTTSQIVWTCLATIFACTWVAIHPNLPGPYDSGFQQFRRQTTMAIIALLGPELIAIWAIRQRLAALDIKKQFNDRFNQGIDPEKTVTERIKRWFASPQDEESMGWTLTHGFFIQMGGLMLYHEGKPARVLTFDDLLNTIENKALDIPRIPEADITGRSKGDGLSKLVVILQMAWFIAQCIGRWSVGLPLAPLEALTLAFAVLNTFTYAVWWSKPQGVVVPIALPFKAKVTSPPSPSTQGAATSANSEIMTPANSQECTPSAEARVTSAVSVELSASSVNTATVVPADSQGGQAEEELLSMSEPSVDELTRGDDEAQAIAKVPWDKSSLFALGHIWRVVWLPSTHISPFGGLLNLWERLSATIGYLICATLKPLQGGGIVVECFPVGKTRVPMFYVPRERIGKEDVKIFVLTILVVPCMFGGLHMIEWSASLFTPTERLLWRVAAGYITAVPLCITLCTYLPNRLVSYLGERVKKMTIRFVSGIPTRIAVTQVVVIYAIARCLLISLSFYTLSHLPEDAYRDLQWSNLLPHV